MPDWMKSAISPVVAAVTAALTGAVRHIWKRQKEQAKQQEAMKDGLRGLLHDRIHERYHECECKGYADVRDRENMELLYESYHALGGNGTGTDLYNKMRELPTAAPAEE